MCAYMFNIVDIETMTPEQQEALTAYLKSAREDLESEIAKLNTKLRRVKKDQSVQRQHAKRKALHKQGLRSVG